MNLISGGIPKSVYDMVKKEGNILKYNRDILTNILEAYFDDMNKYVESNNESLKIYKLYNSIPMQLVNNGFKLYYWLSNATSEIDFVVDTKDGIIPIEVKSGDSTKSKRLSVYMNKYNYPYAIRISSKNFGYNKEKRIKSIPHYAVFLIKKS